MNVPRTGTKRKFLFLLLFSIGAMAIAPLFIHNAYIRHLLIIAMIYAVVAASWDLSLGYAGVFNFAHLAFFAIGAYTGGILVKNLGIPPWAAILAGGLMGSASGLLVCIPVLRVKGIYVCLVTFAYSQLWLHVIRSQGEITGGSRGLVLIPPFSVAGYSFDQHNNLAYYYLFFLILIASTWLLRKTVKSSFGLSIVALRDNEDYAVSRGVPLTTQRLFTFAISAFYPGLVGAGYALYTGIASADLFGFGYLTTVLSMLILGGISTIYGPVIGAFLLGFASEFLNDLGPVKYMLTAAITILTLRFYPDGIVGIFNRLGLFGNQDRSVNNSLKK
jgi:branched-chain amino acid transport system permease protein